MTTAQGQREFPQRVLEQVRKLLESALNSVGVTPTYQVAWTFMRWDALDVTASWPKEKPTRNIHAWLVGQWPRYGVNFEGAHWEDDEAKSERRVRFFSGPLTGQIFVRGSLAQPDIVVINLDSLQTSLAELTKQIAQDDLPQNSQAYALLPKPGPTPSQRGAQL